MKILLRSLILFCLILWVGGVLFFPAVAAIAFRVLPGPEQAGLVVRNCLLTLHTEGMIAGVLLLILLAADTVTRSYGRKLATIGPICCTLAMLALTVFSQYHVIPQMERDRIAVGGDIDKAPAENPQRLDFNQQHAVSVGLEEGVLAAGLLMAIFLARETRPPVRLL
jgi:tetrahydromethanopterin S-methyltransferase subunit F